MWDSIPGPRCFNHHTRTAPPERTFCFETLSLELFSAVSLGINPDVRSQISDRFSMRIPSKVCPRIEIDYEIHSGIYSSSRPEISAGNPS